MCHTTSGQWLVGKLKMLFKPAHCHNLGTAARPEIAVPPFCAVCCSLLRTLGPLQHLMTSTTGRQHESGGITDVECLALATLLLQWKAGPANLPAADVQGLHLAHRALRSLLESCYDGVGGSCCGWQRPASVGLLLLAERSRAASGLGVLQRCPAGKGCTAHIMVPQALCCGVACNKLKGLWHCLHPTPSSRGFDTACMPRRKTHNRKNEQGREA